MFLPRAGEGVPIVPRDSSIHPFIRYSELEPARHRNRVSTLCILVLLTRKPLAEYSEAQSVTAAVASLFSATATDGLVDA